MDLSYGQEYETFRSEVKGFLDQYADRQPKAGSGPRSDATKEWQKLLIEHGYHSRTIPKEYGGYGATPDILKSRIIAEEFSNAQVNTGFSGQGISMLTPVLLEMGTEEQKQYWLPKLASAEILPTAVFTEPNTGSDLQAVRTTAKKDGNEYVINGSKTYISNGQNADLIIVVAKTDTTLGARGISLLVVDPEEDGSPRAGFRRGRNLDKIGQHSADTSELFFDDVRIPAPASDGPEDLGGLGSGILDRGDRPSEGASIPGEDPVGGGVTGHVISGGTA